LLKLLAVLTICAPVHRWTTTADEVPYQFGFNTGTQHREEKKDSNGIVTGEYGFESADGYYNTVQYATDAEGKFRILGRKRIRLTPPKPKVNTDQLEGRQSRQLPVTVEPTTTTTEKVMIYHFNYTAPQHHREEMGFSDSSKVGDYYWDGPDGYRRIITYTADDAGGYRPRMRQIKLPVT